MRRGPLHLGCRAMGLRARGQSWRRSAWLQRASAGEAHPPSVSGVADRGASRICGPWKVALAAEASRRFGALSASMASLTVTRLGVSRVFLFQSSAYHREPEEPCHCEAGEASRGNLTRSVIASPQGVAISKPDCFVADAPRNDTACQIVKQRPSRSLRHGRPPARSACRSHTDCGCSTERSGRSAFVSECIPRVIEGLLAMTSIPPT